jgi:thiol-disulfide isomerase/thioredoxin
LLALTLCFIESPAMAHFLLFLRERRITFIFTRQTFDTESSAPLRTSSEISNFLCIRWLGQLKWYACLPDIPQTSCGCAGFLGPWCAPCVAEMPALSQTYKVFQGNTDVIFLAVNSRWNNDTPDKIRTFVKQWHFDIPIAFDMTDVTKNLDATTLPSLILIDGQGHN